MSLFLNSLCGRVRDVLLTLLVLGLFSIASVHAANYVVSNTDDSGRGSLRAAILLANDAPASADTIDLTGVAGTITLTTGQLEITDALTITGPGADLLTLSGNDASRIFSCLTVLATKS